MQGQEWQGDSLHDLHPCPTGSGHFAQHTTCCAEFQAQCTVHSAVSSRPSPATRRKFFPLPRGANISHLASCIESADI